MINPLKEKRNKILFNYLKNDLTFEEYKIRRNKQNNLIIILLLSSILLFYLSIILGGILMAKIKIIEINGDINKMYKESFIELGKEICSYSNQEFINIEFKELPNKDITSNLICSDTIKSFKIGR